MIFVKNSKYQKKIYTLLNKNYLQKINYLNERIIKIKNKTKPNVPEEKQPGLYVRRVNGKTLTDEEMIKHYINLVKEYGKDGKLDCKWVYGMAVINENGEENTYTWNKDNFYMVDIPSKKMHEGYPLNSISKYKELDKYFTDITEEDKERLKVKEDDVIDFITKSVNN